MKTGARRLLKPIAFGALAALAGFGLVATAGQDPLLVAGQETAPRTEVRLVSDVATVRPGEPFTVGVHVALEDGWRTPWLNAGDVGNGMLATWTLPDGFRADSFAYPIPERFSDPPVASYGYTGEVVFVATVTPPAELEIGRPVRIGLTADLVVCGHTCVPVHADRFLELTVRDAQPTTSGDAALIRRHVDRLPVQTADWVMRAARTDRGFVLGVAPRVNRERAASAAYFFPTDPMLLDHAAEQRLTRTAAGEYRIELTESAYLAGDPTRIEGVLVFEDGNTSDAAARTGLVVSTAVEDAVAGRASEPTEPVTTTVQASGVR